MPRPREFSASGRHSGGGASANVEAGKKAADEEDADANEEVEGAGHGLPFEKRAEFVARLIRMISGS